MKHLNRRILLAFVLSTLAGTLLHFLHDFWPNPLTALISPVRESLWEHLKIIYWPFLAALLLLTRRGERGSRSPWLLSLLVISAAMLAVGYWYHILWEGASGPFDIGLYVVLMAAGFLLPRLFWRLGEKGWWNALLWALTAALGVAILLLTSLPPGGPFFADLSAVRTWLTIPY